MLALGALEKVAGFFHGDEFEIWDEQLHRFRPGFMGRLYPFDRFKTIYHRPTRRETLGLAPYQPLPPSLVIRHLASQEVFMVSRVPHSDSDGNETYDRGVAIHRPSHFAQLVRPRTVGTAPDLGLLQDEVLTDIYIDLEIKGLTKRSMAYEKYKYQYFVTASHGVEVKAGDFLHDGDLHLRVTGSYDDGGFQVIRADSTDEERVSITYRYPLGSGASYDPITGSYTPVTTEDRLFSAYASPITSEEGSADTAITGRDVRLFTDFDHIGFTPTVNHEVLFENKPYNIEKVSRDLESRQWIIDCRRSES